MEGEGRAVGARTEWGVEGDDVGAGGVRRGSDGGGAVARLSNENLGPVSSKPGRAECARILSDLPGRFSGEESVRGSENFT